MTDGDRDDLLLAIAGGVVAVLEAQRGAVGTPCLGRAPRGSTARIDQFQRKLTDLVRTIQEEATEANWRMV